jgi:hypothetical protein
MIGSVVDFALDEDGNVTPGTSARLARLKQDV